MHAQRAEPGRTHARALDEVPHSAVRRPRSRPTNVHDHWRRSANAGNTCPAYRCARVHVGVRPVRPPAHTSGPARAIGGSVQVHQPQSLAGAHWCVARGAVQAARHGRGGDPGGKVSGARRACRRPRTAVPSCGARDRSGVGGPRRARVPRGAQPTAGRAGKVYGAAPLPRPTLKAADGGQPEGTQGARTRVQASEGGVAGQVNAPETMGTEPHIFKSPLPARRTG